VLPTIRKIGHGLCAKSLGIRLGSGVQCGSADGRRHLRSQSKKKRELRYSQGSDWLRQTGISITSSRLRYQYTVLSPSVLLPAQCAGLSYRPSYPVSYPLHHPEPHPLWLGCLSHVPSRVACNVLIWFNWVSFHGGLMRWASLSRLSLFNL